MRVASFAVIASLGGLVAVLQVSRFSDPTITPTHLPGTASPALQAVRRRPPTLSIEPIQPLTEPPVALATALPLPPPAGTFDFEAQQGNEVSRVFVIQKELSDPRPAEAVSKPELEQQSGAARRQEAEEGRAVPEVHQSQGE